MTVAMESIRRGDEMQRFPMTWEEYLAADVVPSEYYGGALVVAAQPSQRHQDVEFRLQLILVRHLAPGTKVTRGWGWIPTGVREELGPDLMVHDVTEEQRALSGIPHLVVEVVSSNRGNDYVAKAQRYAAWGAPSYWIVDPRDHVVVTMELVDGLYVETGRFTSGQATLRYGEVEVSLDIDELLA
ncbi:Uma2 family endonuclease [Nocardioides carbamazepini]|uniref:Uma2 family endonuclease n=1 Tax=Nocardioides carbamazepini TaxID=2854259 RepID=UPI00214A7985|nr:Uma2 family endonuclease [Nocardioides carbamazepini]MCR1784244.1 Uma2 family endonuclease [Nocardioides carbamazepini]